jgi:translation initiation factor eIF-2B subunit delta
MKQSYQNLLQDVKTDHTSGASVVAKKAISCLEALAKEKSSVGVAELTSEIERVANEILKAQPNMAQLTNLFNTIFVTLDAAPPDDSLALARKISGEAKRFAENAKKAVAKVAELGAQLISADDTILTHSNSSTILAIIKKAHEAGKPFQVIISESRPACEGQERAQELSKMGIRTIYLIDAAISMGVERADIVLLGADSISESSLVNKIGSKAICLLAREALVPCYAASESSKFTPQKLSPKKEPLRDPKEVWASPPPEISVENYYFDEVPLDLFTGVITEDGVLTPEEMGGKIRSQVLHPRLLEMLK